MTLSAAIWILKRARFPSQKMVLAKLLKKSSNIKELEEIRTLDNVVFVIFISSRERAGCGF